MIFTIDDGKDYPKMKLSEIISQVNLEVTPPLTSQLLNLQFLFDENTAKVTKNNKIITIECKCSYIEINPTHPTPVYYTSTAGEGGIYTAEGYSVVDF